MNAELPADVVKELRISQGLSRAAFAELLGEGYTEEMVRNLESFGKKGFPRTLFSAVHLRLMRKARLISEGDDWDRRFIAAMANQGRLLLDKKRGRSSPKEAVTPSRPSLSQTSENTSPGQAVDAAAPTSPPGRIGETSPTEEVVSGGSQAARSRLRRWWPALIVLVAVAMGGCLLGTQLMRWVGRGGPSLAIATPLASTATAWPDRTAERPSQLVLVVTATPGPVSPTSTPEVRIVTATPGPDTPVPTPVILVVTATPEPVTATPTITVIPAATRTPTPSRTPTPEPTIFPLPFEDDFDGGQKPDWVEVRGKWRMVNLRFTPDDARDALAVVGDLSWSNYAIDVNVDFGATSGVVYVITRYANGSYMSFGVPANAGAKCRWALCVRGDCRDLAGYNCYWLGSGHSIRVEVIGNNYIGYLDGSQMLILQDDTLTSGQAGLKTNAHGVITFDNFKVTGLP